MCHRCPRLQISPALSSWNSWICRNPESSQPLAALLVQRLGMTDCSPWEMAHVQPWRARNYSVGWKSPLRGCVYALVRMRSSENTSHFCEKLSRHREAGVPATAIDRILMSLRNCKNMSDHTARSPFRLGNPTPAISPRRGMLLPCNTRTARKRTPRRRTPTTWTHFCGTSTPTSCRVHCAC